MKIFWWYIVVFVLIVFMVFVVCQVIYCNYGYVFVEDELVQVVVGQIWQDELEGMIGCFSVQGFLIGLVWYYVGLCWQNYGFCFVCEIEWQVVVISFNEGGIVVNVECFGQECG